MEWEFLAVKRDEQKMDRYSSRSQVKFRHGRTDALKMGSSKGIGREMVLFALLSGCAVQASQKQIGFQVDQDSLQFPSDVLPPISWSRSGFLSGRLLVSEDGLRVTFQEEALGRIVAWRLRPQIVKFVVHPFDATQELVTNFGGAYVLGSPRSGESGYPLERLDLETGLLSLCDLERTQSAPWIFGVHGLSVDDSGRYVVAWGRKENSHGLWIIDDCLAKRLRGARSGETLPTCSKGIVSPLQDKHEMKIVTEPAAGIWLPTDEGATVQEASIAKDHLAIIQRLGDSWELVLRSLVTLEIVSRQKYAGPLANVRLLTSDAIAEVDAHGLLRLRRIEDQSVQSETELCSGPHACPDGDRCEFAVRGSNGHLVISRRCYGDRGHRGWWVVDTKRGIVIWKSTDESVLDVGASSSSVFVAGPSSVRQVITPP